MNIVCSAWHSITCQHLSPNTKPIKTRQAQFPRHSTPGELYMHVHEKGPAWVPSVIARPYYKAYSQVKLSISLFPHISLLGCDFLSAYFHIPPINDATPGRQETAGQASEMPIGRHPTPQRWRSTRCPLYALGSCLEQTSQP
jgi:hypothetical protein